MNVMAGGAEIDSATGELYCPTCEKTFAFGDRCAQDNTRLVRIAKTGDLLIGRELDGRYTIVEKLGQGGMGTVYRGTQHSVGREVAIKVVSPSLVAEGTVIKRFLREAKLASRLSHPNAVAVLDFGQTEDGLFYLILELVRGQTLDKILETERTLSPQRIVRIGAQICDALEGAHQLNIVHRDLKPANVMVMSSGRDLVKVLDFGLAKSLTPDLASVTMTNAGALLGTPAFMPPELVTGRDCDARADLYSLGCLLHYAASGDMPFVAGSVHELIAMHASEPPPPLPGLPVPLARVIARLLEKEPARRFQTAASTREALEAALSTAAPVEQSDAPSAPVTGPTTVLGWSGTITVPKRPSSATPAGATPIASTRPLQRGQQLVTPVSGVSAVPRHIPLTPLPSTPSPREPTAPETRKRPAILLGVGAIVLTVSAAIAFLALRGTKTVDAPVAPAVTSPVAPAPIPPPPVAPPPVAPPPVAPPSPVVEAVVEPPPAVPTPVITKSKPVVTKRRPVVPNRKPVVTKPKPKPPTPTGPIRGNPGAF